MVNSISVNKYIYKVLSEDTELKKLVGKRVYPMIANIEKVQYPFIVFSRTNLVPQYTKDYNTEDLTDVSIIVCSDNYSNSIEIAEVVRKVMYKLHRYSDNNININYCRLDSVYETFDSDTYMQQLDYRLSIS